MAGTYPTDPAPSRVQIESISPTLVSVSINLRRQARSQNTQRFRLTLSYPPGLDWSQVKKIFGFIVAQRGQAETFAVALPEYYNTGTAGACTVSSVNSDKRSFNVSGVVAGATFEVGDFIKIAGDDKLYTVTQDTAADGAGAATVHVAPALLTTPLVGAQVSTHSRTSPLTLTCAAAEDSVTANMTLAQRVGFQVDLNEVV